MHLKCRTGQQTPNLKLDFCRAHEKLFLNDILRSKNLFKSNSLSRVSNKSEKILLIHKTRIYDHLISRDTISSLVPSIFTNIFPWNEFFLFRFDEKWFRLMNLVSTDPATLSSWNKRPKDINFNPTRQMFKGIQTSSPTKFEKFSCWEGKIR